MVTLWDFPGMRRPEVLLEAGEAPGIVPWVKVAFSADGGMLATIDRRKVTLWDLEGRRPVTSFGEHFDSVGVAVAPDNRTVLLVGQDGSARFTLLARSNMGGVHFIDLDPGRAARRVCSSLGRSLTQAEWDEFLPEQPYRATCG